MGLWLASPKRRQGAVERGQRAFPFGDEVGSAGQRHKRDFAWVAFLSYQPCTHSDAGFVWTGTPAWTRASKTAAVALTCCLPPQRDTHTVLFLWHSREAQAPRFATLTAIDACCPTVRLMPRSAIKRAGRPSQHHSRISTGCDSAPSTSAILTEPRQSVQVHSEMAASFLQYWYFTFTLTRDIQLTAMKVRNARNRL